MFGVIFSVLIAFALSFFSAFQAIDAQSFQMAALFLGPLFFILFVLTTLFALAPLQKIEQNFTPRLLELFRSDRHNRFIWIWFLFFTFSSLVLGFFQFKVGALNPQVMMIAWIVGLGITFDLYHHYLQRLFGYLNPYVIIRMLTDRAAEAVRSEDQGELCNYVDALAEVGVKSLSRTGTSLCGNSVDELQKISRIFLESVKNVGHDNSEQVSYVLFYTFQRFEMIAAKAVEMRLEPVLTMLITSLGKMTINAAKCDLSLVSFPLYYIGTFSLASQEEELSEVGVHATCTLLSVGKEILESVDIQYAELQDPYFTLIDQLEQITKEMFRQDKSINIKILTQPFLDLRELFTDERMASHPDAAPIIADIDRVIDEFNNLELVMRTVPRVKETADSE